MSNAQFTPCINAQLKLAVCSHHHLSFARKSNQRVFDAMMHVKLVHANQNLYRLYHEFSEKVSVASLYKSLSNVRRSENSSVNLRQIYGISQSPKGPTLLTKCQVNVYSLNGTMSISRTFALAIISLEIFSEMRSCRSCQYCLYEAPLIFPMRVTKQCADLSSQNI